MNADVLMTKVTDGIALITLGGTQAVGSSVSFAK